MGWTGSQPATTLVPMTNVTSATAKRSDTISVTYELSISVDELVSEMVSLGEDADSLTVNDLIRGAKRWAREVSGISSHHLDWKYEGQSVLIFSDSIPSDPTSPDSHTDFLYSFGVIEQ